MVTCQAYQYATAVEAEDVAHHRDATGVPALVGISAALSGRREQGGEHPLSFQELDEVGVPDPFAVLFEQHALAALLEEGDRRYEDAPRFGVERGEVGGVWVEQKCRVHWTAMAVRIICSSTSRKTVLAEEDLLANEEGRHTKGAAIVGGLGVRHQPGLDLRVLRGLHEQFGVQTAFNQHSSRSWPGRPSSARAPTWPRRPYRHSARNS